MGESRHTILVAEDEPLIQELLKSLFEDAGYEVLIAGDGLEVLEFLKKRKNDVRVILLDIKLPNMDGFAVMKQMQTDSIETPVIVMTAYGSGNMAIKAIQQGAYDYITKPFDDLETVLHKVERLMEYAQLSKEVNELKTRVVQGERIIGNSPSLLEIFKTIGKVASSNATVLITGETGTGKELVANAIHTNSRYSKGPFVPVNCGALPENLLESELFGYEAGAFTGATKMRKGRFEMADKGTIFLDEVGEMSLNIQRKLLRVLQERVVDRLGGNLPIKVDVRVIAATNRDLNLEVDNGHFRSDLFFRLNVVSIHMPPLRERKEDIPALVDFFLDKHRYTPGSPPARISNEAIQVLQEYNFPGNVRELENLIQRAVVDARGRTITSQNLNIKPEESYQSGDGVMPGVENLVKKHTPLKVALSNYERQLLLEALRQSENDEELAATLLGVDQEDLRTRLKKFGITEFV
jgi:two-component system response regulator AtoC